MTQSTISDDRLDRIEQKLDHLSTTVDALSATVDTLYPQIMRNLTIALVTINRQPSGWCNWPLR
jgi:hypothetical protein